MEVRRQRGEAKAMPFSVARLWEAISTEHIHKFLHKEEEKIILCVSGSNFNGKNDILVLNSEDLVIFHKWSLEFSVHSLLWGASKEKSDIHECLVTALSGP